MALVLTSIVMQIGTEFVWTVNGTCGPRNGYQQIAISPAVGGAAGSVGDAAVDGRGNPAVFHLRDANEQALAFVYGEDEPGRRATVVAPIRRSTRFSITPADAP